MKKYNVSKPKKIIGANGETKTIWRTVGEMTEFVKQDGSISRILEMYTDPIDTTYSIFERTEGGYKPAAAAPAPARPVATAPAGAPQYEDIPF